MCLLQETQEYMAELTFKLHELIGKNCKVYVFGFGGCYEDGKWLAKYQKNTKVNKIGDYKSNQTPFYFEKIKELYWKSEELKNSVFIAKHFSGNHIFEDLVSKIPTDILMEAFNALKESRDALFEDEGDV